MPKTCIHLEKLKETINDWELTLKINNKDDYTLFSTLKRKHGLGDSWCSWIGSNDSVARLIRDRLKSINEDLLGDYELVIDKGNLKNFEKQLKAIKDKFLSIANECNCESENNQQLVLRRSAETERNNLQIAKRSLESRISDLQRDRDNWRSSSWSLQTERDSLKGQVREKNELVKSGEVVLRTTQNQLTTVQNQLTRKNTEYDDLNRRFNNLQIESNNKDNEINSLKEELKSSQNVDLRYKERKLDELVRNFDLNRARVISLSNAYERLIRAREDYNRDNITNANNEIEVIKAELFQTNVSVNDLHKIYKTCEKTAELKVKQERLHEQQYQAQQEQPTNN